MSQQDKGKQSKNNPRVKNCLQNIQNKKIKYNKINKNKAPHKINHPQPWVHHPHHHC
jgi:hypothetical protein